MTLTFSQMENLARSASLHRLSHSTPVARQLDAIRSRFRCVIQDVVLEM